MVIGSASIWSRAAAVNPLGGSCGNSSSPHRGSAAARCRCTSSEMPVAPGVRDDGHAGQVGERGEGPDRRCGRRLQGVRLQHVEAAVAEQRGERGQALVVLAAGQPQRVQAVPQPGQAGVVVPGQRLLQPVHAEPLQLAGHPERGAEVPHPVPAEAGVGAGLVGVHHQLELVPDRVPHRGGHGQVVARVVGVEAQLDRGEAVGRQPGHVLRPGLWCAQLTGGAVGADRLVGGRPTAGTPAGRRPGRAGPRAGSPARTAVGPRISASRMTPASCSIRVGSAPSRCGVTKRSTATAVSSPPWPAPTPTRPSSVPSSNSSTVCVVCVRPRPHAGRNGAVSGNSTSRLRIPVIRIRTRSAAMTRRSSQHSIGGGRIGRRR